MKDHNSVPGSPEDWKSSPLPPVAGHQGMMTNLCGNWPTKEEQRTASENCPWLHFHQWPGSFVLGNLGSCVVSNCNFINPLHAHCMCGTHKHLPRWYEDGRQSWVWRGQCTERGTQFLHRTHTVALYCFKPTSVTSRIERRLSTSIWVKHPLALTGNRFCHTGDD